MRAFCMVFLSAAMTFSVIVWAQIAPPATGTSMLSAPEIVQRMQQHNERRQAALHSYSSDRSYQLKYHGVGGSDASMAVHLEYQSPGQKEFTVLHEEGSKMLREHVLHKAIESEKEAMEQSNRHKTALTPANYKFQLLGMEQTSHGPAYVLQVDPLVDNKFTYRAKVWVDAADFAVVRIAGEPAKNPSWWIKHSTFDTRYTKVGDFWFPAENIAVSHIRFGGEAHLTITYDGYSHIDASPLDLELARSQPGR